MKPEQQGWPELYYFVLNQLLCVSVMQRGSLEECAELHSVSCLYLIGVQAYLNEKWDTNRCRNKSSAVITEHQNNNNNNRFGRFSVFSKAESDM